MPETRLTPGNQHFRARAPRRRCSGDARPPRWGGRGEGPSPGSWVLAGRGWVRGGASRALLPVWPGPGLDFLRRGRPRAGACSPGALQFRRRFAPERASVNSSPWQPGRGRLYTRPPRTGAPSARKANPEGPGALRALPGWPRALLLLAAPRPGRRPVEPLQPVFWAVRTAGVGAAEPSGGSRRGVSRGCA